MYSAGEDRYSLVDAIKNLSYQLNEDYSLARIYNLANQGLIAIGFNNPARTETNPYAINYLNREYIEKFSPAGEDLSSLQLITAFRSAEVACSENTLSYRIDNNLELEADPNQPSLSGEDSPLSLETISRRQLFITSDEIKRFCAQKKSAETVVHTAVALTPLTPKDLEFLNKLDRWEYPQALFLIHGYTPPNAFDLSYQAYAHFIEEKIIAENSLLSGELGEQITKAGKKIYQASPNDWINWAIKKGIPKSSSSRGLTRISGRIELKHAEVFEVEQLSHPTMNREELLEEYDQDLKNQILDLQANNCRHKVENTFQGNNPQNQSSINEAENVDKEATSAEVELKFTYSNPPGLTDFGKCIRHRLVECAKENHAGEAPSKTELKSYMKERPCAQHDVNYDTNKKVFVCDGKDVNNDAFRKHYNRLEITPV